MLGWLRLARNEIPWPRLGSGHLDLRDGTIRAQAKGPHGHLIAPIHELRSTLADLRLESLAVGYGRDVLFGPSSTALPHWIWYGGSLHRTPLSGLADPPNSGAPASLFAEVMRRQTLSDGAQSGAGCKSTAPVVADALDFRGVGRR